VLCLAAHASPQETRWSVAGSLRAPTRVLELTSAPTDGALPLEVHPPARFAAFALAGRRVFVAVSTERLWFDRDFDGRFESKEWVLGRPGAGGVTYRLVVKLPIGKAGAPFAVPVQFVLKDGVLRFSHALDREGDVELGGRLRAFVLLDGDFDLRFNSGRHDALVIDRDGDGRLQRFTGSHERVGMRNPFRIGDQAFRCEPLSPGGEFVSFAPVENVPPEPPHRLPKSEPPPSGIEADDPGGDLDKYKRALETVKDIPGTLRAIGRIGRDDAGAFLIGLALNAEQPVWLRAAALRALGYRPFAKHATFLERQASTRQDPVLRLAALDAMHAAGVVGRELGMASLLRDDEDVVVVRRAAKYLACVAPRMLDPAIMRLKRDEHRAAVYAMAREYGRDVPAPATVLACARSRSAPLRALALRDLFLLGRPEAVELAQVAALEPGVDSAVAQAASITLAAVADRRSIAIVLDLASGGNEHAAREARRLLARQRDDEAVRVIAKQLSHKRPGPRALAIDILALIPTKGAGAAIVGRLGREEDPILRNSLRRASLAHAHPRVVRELVEPVRKAAALDARREAVDQLIERGQNLAAVRAALVQILGWSDWEVRILVLRALQSGRYEDLALGIARCLRHRIWQVRLSAAEALGEQRVDLAVEPLIRALEKEGNGRVKTALAEALHDLTGDNLGEYGSRWRKWWQKHGERFVVPAVRPVPASKAGAGKKKPGTKTVSFYGIPVRSSRIIFVLDRSGSMNMHDTTDGRTRLDRAKIELLRTVDGLPLGTQANIVFFGTGAEEWRHGLVPLSRTNRRAVKGFLKGIDATGGTDLYEALALALSDRNVEAVYLLSDGSPTGKHRGFKDMLGAVGLLNRVRRVRIHCIALGHESLLLRELAKQHDGVYERR